jgi:hypothetical protein
VFLCSGNKSVAVGGAAEDAESVLGEPNHGPSAGEGEPNPKPAPEAGFLEPPEMKREMIVWESLFLQVRYRRIASLSTVPLVPYPNLTPDHRAANMSSVTAIKYDIPEHILSAWLERKFGYAQYEVRNVA